MRDLLKMGDKGTDVQALQYLLYFEPADGVYDERFTERVKEFQHKYELSSIDGIIGKATKEAIAKNLPVTSTKKNRTSVYTRAIQLLIGCDADGIFGTKTKTAVTAYQMANNLSPDGAVGQQTWSMLFGIAEKVEPSNSVQPPNFKQYDKRWAKVMYSNHNDPAQTMKSSACGPTSMCDIVAEWWDKDALPTDLAQMSLKWGTRTANSGTTGTFFKKCYEYYKASKYICTSNIETAIGCLKAGGYVVVCFGKSKWTKGGHYCCMWKYDGKYFYINDPASSSSSRAKGTYNEVKSARKGFYCFWR